MSTESSHQPTTETAAHGSHRGKVPVSGHMSTLLTLVSIILLVLLLASGIAIVDAGYVPSPPVVALLRVAAALDFVLGLFGYGLMLRRWVQIARRKRKVSLKEELSDILLDAADNEKDKVPQALRGCWPPVALGTVLVTGLVLATTFTPVLTQPASGRIVTVAPTPTLIPTPTATPIPPGSVTEFALPSANNPPFGITSGPDGNLWVAQAPNQIASLTPQGTATEYTLPAPYQTAALIAAGPDGNVWFTGSNPNAPSGSEAYIGRITPNGAITMFPIGNNQNSVYGLAAGPDGNIWFTGTGLIGRLTPTGSVTVFTESTQGYPTGITAGPDGNLWYTVQNLNRIGRITTAGAITEFAISTHGSLPLAITAGPDGNLWFVEALANKIGRVTTAGTITEFPVPGGAAGSISSGRPPGPKNIASGPDGNVWFTMDMTGQVGQVTPAGVITMFPLPSGNKSTPQGITTGPDGNLWCAEFGANKIARMAP